AAVRAQRYVKHGANAERFEIGVAEVPRARIGAGVVGSNHALAFDGIEIRGRKGALEPVTAPVEAGAARVEAGALDAAVRVVEAPQADALGVERCRRGLQNGVQ